MTNTLSTKTVKIIKQALLVAMVTKTDEILLDDFGLSGRSLTSNILIIQPMDGGFEFKALGIGRVAELKARLTLILDDPTLTVEFEEPPSEPDSGNVFKLIFKTKKTKIEYRCMKPDRIKTKKTLTDPIYHTFELNEEAVKFMTAGCAAMGTNTVNFTLNDQGQIHLKIIDNEGDMLEHLVTNKVTTHPACDVETFSFAYSVPKLAPLLKSGDTTVNVTHRGALNLNSEGFGIFLVPEIN